MRSHFDTAWLTGAIADLPTPFDSRGGLDLAAAARLLEHQIAAGATAVLVGETMGEMSTLTAEEHVALIGAAVAVSRGRLRVLAGAGSNATAQAALLARQAEVAGADAIVSVVPYYNKPTQAGIIAHFHGVAAATALPIVVHDAPARTLRPLADGTLAELAQSPCFVGLCDGSGDMTRPLRLRGRLPGHFRLLAGHPATATAFASAAEDGCISALAALLPGLMREWRGACRDGDHTLAASLHERVAPLQTLLAQDPTPASMKYALSLLQHASPCLRLPMVAPDSAAKAAITQAMAQALGP